MLNERRKYPRFHFNLPIKIFNPGFDIVTETKDISGNGVYCSINTDIPAMTKLEIILLIPLMKARNKKILKKVLCKGVVVRNEYTRTNGKRKYNLGIFFSEIKESDRKVLLSYMNNTKPSYSKN
ncbi:MAG: PilZ domain-containing protein [Candidatus Omnitrophica bacterium]|nr:PilZ domain-containing protein [Candidatus Omnitrophota bacterium]